MVELCTEAVPGLCFLLHSLGVNWMMMVARHFRRRLLILSVSTLGFVISSFSVLLASDFTSSVVSVLDGDTLEVLHNQHPERTHKNLEDPCGGERPGGLSPLGHAGNRTSNGRAGRANPEFDYRSNMASRMPIAAMLLRTRMASKSDRNSLIKCSHLLYTNRTAESAFRRTEDVLSRAGAGGIGSMLQGIRSLKGWRRTHERPR